MEGMVLMRMMQIKPNFVKAGDCGLTLDGWTQEVVIKLLKTAHSQWMYCNVQVHDTVLGSHGIKRKKEIQRYIED